MDTRHHQPLQALNFQSVLEIISSHAFTDYGRQDILALEPRPLQDLQEREFQRIQDLMIALQRDKGLVFEGIRDVTKPVKQCRIPGSFLQPGELLDIAGVIRGAIKLRRHILEEDELLASLTHLAERLIDAPELVSEIHAKIDSDSAIVKDNASTKLREIRHSLRSSHQKNRRKLDDLLKKFSGLGYLLDIGYTVEDDRFVLAVKSSYRSKIRGIVYSHSASGGTVYIEPDELVEVANEIRRLMEEELQEERRILTELTDQVRERLADIRTTMATVAELDSLQARAVYAEKCGAFKPVLGGGDLKLVEARHPLLLNRKGLKATIPLNMQLESNSRTLIITGPNAGGKTVALKTLGLITMMAHAGIIPPVGADTSIPPIDAWHVIIGDDQSLESDLSSFSGHLTRLNEVFADTGESKLILIDEIAAGTDPTEGSVLAMAYLEEIVRKRWWAVVTTHMGELKLFAHKNKGVRNGSMQFDREKLCPTYRFQADTPGSSYALEIADRVGLPAKIIRRSRDLLGQERLKMEDLIEELSGRLEKTEELQRSLEIKSTRTAGLERLLRERLDVLDRDKKQLAGEAAREADIILKEANRTIEKAVKEIRENQASKEAIKKAHELVDTQKEVVESIRAGMAPKKRPVQPKMKPKKEKAQKPVAKKPVKPDLPEPVKVGSRVKLENGEKGEVLALQGNRAQVAVGSIKLWMPLEQMTPIQGEKPKGGGVQVVLQPADDEPVSMELDLRGKRYEEAEEELGRYLEALELAGMSFARIVHGKGTGALRSLVRQHLRRSGSVWAFRDGEPGEGGDGVTVIKR